LPTHSRRTCCGHCELKADFSAADLQRFTEVEQEIPLEQVIKEIEELHRSSNSTLPIRYPVWPISRRHRGAGQFRCLCKNANVPCPWISWPPVKNSMAVRSASPRRA